MRNLLDAGDGVTGLLEQVENTVRAGQVRRMIVAHGGRVALIGIAVGLAAAVVLTRLLDSLLFRVAAVDWATFAGMAAVLVGVALLASYIPAKRASSVDPVNSLRADA